MALSITRFLMVYLASAACPHSQLLRLHDIGTWHGRRGRIELGTPAQPSAGEPPEQPSGEPLEEPRSGSQPGRHNVRQPRDGAPGDKYYNLPRKNVAILPL